MPIETSVILKPSTRLSKALELHPDVLEYIISLEPHDFTRLRNPVMRKLMPPRISLGRVAAIAKIPVQTLLERIASLSGAMVAPIEAKAPLPQSSSQAPDWVVFANRTTVQTVNLLPLDAALEEDPMPPVMLIVKKLQPGEVMRVWHKWEPQPFYDVWSKMPGLEWYSEQVNPDEWFIWIRRI